jgi:hypothetical protein
VVFVLISFYLTIWFNIVGKLPIRQGIFFGNLVALSPRPESERLLEAAWVLFIASCPEAHKALHRKPRVEWR